jgi:hypothetical protein
MTAVYKHQGRIYFTICFKQFATVFVQQTWFNTKNHHTTLVCFVTAVVQIALSLARLLSESRTCVFHRLISLHLVLWSTVMWSVTYPCILCSDTRHSMALTDTDWVTEFVTLCNAMKSICFAFITSFRYFAGYHFSWSSLSQSTTNSLFRWCDCRSLSVHWVSWTR